MAAVLWTKRRLHEELAKRDEALGVAYSALMELGRKLSRTGGWKKVGKQVLHDAERITLIAGYRPAPQEETR